MKPVPTGEFHPWSPILSGGEWYLFYPTGKRVYLGRRISKKAIAEFVVYEQARWAKRRDGE